VQVLEREVERSEGYITKPRLTRWGRVLNNLPFQPTGVRTEDQSAVEVSLSFFFFFFFLLHCFVNPGGKKGESKNGW
jgi:hypothetical protein